MPTNFERVAMTLDNMDQAATKALGYSLDTQVKSSLQTLSTSYSNLTSSRRPPVDYSLPESQLAYAFTYLAAHADLLFRTLDSVRIEVERALISDPIKVVCVGGGPGSDALGFAKFLETGLRPLRPTRFVVLDREPKWEFARDALFETLGSLNLDSEFRLTDLASGAPWTPNWDFVDADLYTLSFTLSEVWSFNQTRSVSLFLEQLVTRARRGSLFAYSDNSGGSFLPHAERDIARRNDIEEIFSFDDTHVLISGDEQASALANFSTRYERSPKITGRVNRRLWRKR